LETFKECNPGYGITIDETTVKTLISEARNEPRKANAYRVLHLNQWQGTCNNWLSPQTWKACQGEFPDLASKDCFVGLDLARRHDWAACFLVFVVNESYYLLLAAAGQRDHLPLPGGRICFSKRRAMPSLSRNGTTFH
jgi:phage terminase large subunit-like protein